MNKTFILKSTNSMKLERGRERNVTVFGKTNSQHFKISISHHTVVFVEP